MQRAELNEQQSALIIGIINDVVKYGGILSDKLLERIFAEGGHSDPAIVNYVQEKIMPELSEREIFHLTLSVLQGHAEHHASMAPIFSNNDKNLLGAMLYDQFRKKMEEQKYNVANRDHPAVNVMDALHLQIVNSYQSNLSGPPASIALDALNKRYKVDHQYAINQLHLKSVLDKKSLQSGTSGVTLSLKVKSDLPSRLFYTSGTIKLPRIREEQKKLIEDNRKVLETELNDKVVWHEKRKELKVSFLSQLLDALNNRFYMNKTPAELVMKVLKDPKFDFEEILKGKDSRVRKTLSQFLGGDEKLATLQKRVQERVQERAKETREQEERAKVTQPRSPKK